MARKVLTEGPLNKHLFRLSAPLFLGAIAVFSINLVDALYIAYLGEEALAAFGFATATFGIGWLVMSSLGTALNSVASRLHGASDADGPRHSTSVTLILSAAIGVVLAVVSLLWMPHFVALVGATGRAADLAVDYANIFYVSFGFTFLPAVVGSALAACGDSKTPMLLFFGASVINALLDPCLIFGIGPFPELGVVGAALSTAIAQSLVGLVSLVVLLRDSLLRPQWQGLAARFVGLTRDLAAVAIPVAITGLVGTLSAVISTRVLSGFGDAAVGAIAAGGRIAEFSVQVPAALGMGLAPLVGQNWGAAKYQRSSDALKIARRWGVLAAGLCVLCISIASPLIASHTVDGAELGVLLALYLSTAPIGGIAQAHSIMGRQFLNAVGSSRIVTAITSVNSVLAIIILLSLPPEWGISALFALFALFPFINAGAYKVATTRVLKSKMAESAQDAL